MPEVPTAPTVDTAVYLVNSKTQSDPILMSFPPSCVRARASNPKWCSSLYGFRRIENSESDRGFRDNFGRTPFVPPVRGETQNRRTGCHQGSREDEM